MAADISLGAANGARAVVYVQRQLQALPQLRPLVLVVKAFLRQHSLNEACCSHSSLLRPHLITLHAALLTKSVGSELAPALKSCGT